MTKIYLGVCCFSVFFTCRLPTTRHRINRNYVNSMEKGMQERDSEIVEAMLSKGLTLQEIADLTGISVEKVKKGMHK